MANEPYEPRTSAAKITPPLKTKAATDEPVTIGFLNYDLMFLLLLSIFFFSYMVRVRIFRSASVSNGSIRYLWLVLPILKSSLSLIVSWWAANGLNELIMIIVVLFSY